MFTILFLLVLFLIGGLSWKLLKFSVKLFFLPLLLISAIIILFFHLIWLIIPILIIWAILNLVQH